MGKSLCPSTISVSNTIHQVLGDVTNLSMVSLIKCYVLCLRWTWDEDESRPEQVSDDMATLGGGVGTR